MGNREDNEKWLSRLHRANETEISEILTTLGIGWYDSQIVERIMYQKSIQEKIGIIQELIVHKNKYKQCMEGYISKNVSNVCLKMFDGWTCWNETAAGNTAVSPCPAMVPGFDPSRNGFKECLYDGTWFRHPDSNLVWSNYTTCINLDDFQWKLFINRLYEAGYLISVLALVLSLIIFCTFKCLECTRVKIHRNLFASFIIDNLLWVAWYRFIIADEYVVLTNPWWCKWLFVLVQYFLIANYFWMFCEGFYLHTLLVFAFLRSESQLLKGFYVLGWLGPSIPISFYVYFRLKDGFTEDQACWIEPHHQMFVTMPVCISLVLNLIFLINILRVLVTKLNDQRGFRNPSGTSSSVSTSPENQYSLKKAARATLILIPLLGVHYLLLPFRPNPGTTYEAIYDIVSAITSSLQGFCVAILFCFCNTEVISVFRRRVCPKFCVRNHSSPTHANRGDSAMPTSMSIVVIQSPSSMEAEEKL
ncbi:unnamed protein product [Orchesella dallaii]|uniref:Calcitonin gene-related peptide type 1 receptor n=1 Tax=Orchesella dallaii TaxID=48710 RepID=A0ABP1R0N8_9HEXA